MSHMGQCPSCRVVYELDDDAIGSVMQCECGLALFVCDVAGFSEIPVHCTQCDGEYVVDSEGAGEVVECECGLELTVPTVVLRQPMASPGANPAALLARQSESTAASVSVIECPQCGKRYSAGQDDIDDEAECGCGAVFAIAALPDGTFAARTRKSASESNDKEDRTPARRKKSVSLVSILGVAAVALLLLISIIMFVTRDRKRVAAIEAKESKTVVVPGTPNKQPSQPASLTNQSFAAPEMTPITPGTTARSADSVRPIPDPGRATALPADVSGSSLPKKVAYLLAPPPDPPLPEPKPARKVVPIIAVGDQGLTFERAYAEAFQAYEETKRLQKAVAGSSGNEQSDEVQQYHEQLGLTLGLLGQTLDLATRQSGNQKVNELRYLLTYLHFTAGRLAEAGVLGETVARWGDIDNPATLEAAMIALAATQEANETGWGISSEVGELDQMNSIATVIAARWPDHPQLDLIWMNLGQRYESFGQSLAAANAFARVPDSSSRFGQARLVAGSALWAQYRKNLAAGDEQASQTSTKMLSRAEKFLSQGVEKLAANLDQPTTSIMAAKLNLACIALVSGDLQKAESWLVDSPMPVIDSVGTAKSTEATVQVSEGFVRSVFELLFTIRSQRRELAGAKEALTMMASKLGSSDVDFGKMFLGVITDYIDQLASSAVVTREQFSTLSELIEPLKQHDSTLTVPNVLWLGESWSRLGERAATPQLARQCYAKAAAAYGLAMNRSDFPPSSKQSALIRRAELLREAGQLMDVIPLLESVLRQSPNAFAIQIQAAEILQQDAIESGQPERLVAAIGGPDDSAGNPDGSPIWGWAKLVTTLHAQGGDEDDDQNRDRLLKCQYNLAQCQWLIAQSTSDPQQRQELLSDCRRSLGRLLATTDAAREPWYSRLRELQSEVASEK